MFDDQSSKLQTYLFALSSNSKNLIYNGNFLYFISEEIKLYEMVGKNFTLLYKVLYRNWNFYKMIHYRYDVVSFAAYK